MNNFNDSSAFFALFFLNMWYNGIPRELPASCVLLKQYLCQQSSYLRAEPKLMIYYFYYYYCAKLRIAINQSRRDECNYLSDKQIAAI